MSRRDESKPSDDWTTIDLPTSSGNNKLRVSNANLPENLMAYPRLLSDEEVAKVMDVIDEQEEHRWEYEGFGQRRHVQRYRAPPLVEKTSQSNEEKKEETTTTRRRSDVEHYFGFLIDKLLSCVPSKAQRPTEVIVEDYRISSSNATNNSNSGVVTTFEWSETCLVCGDICSCYVAQLVLGRTLLQHLNRPKERSVECWQLESPNHRTDILMEPNMLLVKSGEALWDWRSRIVTNERVYPEGDRENDRAILVTFKYLPSASLQNGVSSRLSEVSSDGSQPNGASSAVERAPMPPLDEVLTIIVTTSPIRSHPSTELLERTFATFNLGGAEFAYKCRKVIVCDGCRVLEEGTDNKKITRKHSNVKQALRNGVATSVQAENYRQFKEAVRCLCEEANRDQQVLSPFRNVEVVELPERHGYGFALRHALRHCVTTPYVCVIQHDRTFMRPTPVEETMRAMWNSSDKIKYVGMSMRSNLMYRDNFNSKYGRAANAQLGEMMLRPKELLLDAQMYGPNGTSVQNFEYSSEKMRENLAALAETTYKGSIQNMGNEDWIVSQDPGGLSGKHQLSLTPTLFWYDNTHCCETAHYRDFIFHEKYRMVAKGGFVEDKLSPVIKKSVDRLGLNAGHARFGCYILDDHSGFFFTGHLDGGSYLTCEGRQQFRQNSR